MKTDLEIIKEAIEALESYEDFLKALQLTGVAKGISNEIEREALANLRVLRDRMENEK